MKKIIVAFSFALLFCGCISNKDEIDNFIDTSTDVKVSTSFNEEHYIWEKWFFSTNRVDR